MSDLSRQSFTALRQIIVTAHINARKAENNALVAAMCAGDALRSVRDRKLVRHGQVEAFYRETCSSVRTARDYIALAENRGLLSTQIGDGFADLGIGAALRLIRKTKGIRKPDGNPKNQSEPPPKSLKDWTDAEIRDALSTLSFERFVRIIPNAFRPSLAQHAGGQILRLEQARNPNKRLKNVELKLVHSVEEIPPTTH
jgi:hypothetical protein